MPAPVSVPGDSRKFTNLKATTARCQPRARCCQPSRRKFELLYSLSDAPFLSTAVYVPS